MANDDGDTRSGSEDTSKDGTKGKQPEEKREYPKIDVRRRNYLTK
ncbi:hypothetical protein [Streptomyces cyaneochromogenes]|nr:hypothetical protein [Streptomyces cyaneochromogenes]